MMIDEQKKSSICVYGAITAAIVLGSFIAAGIMQHVNAQGGASQNATSSGASAGKGNNTSGGGGQGTK